MTYLSSCRLQGVSSKRMAPGGGGGGGGGDSDTGEEASRQTGRRGGLGLRDIVEMLHTQYVPVCSTWWRKQPYQRRWLPFECASMSEGKALTLVTQRERLRAHHANNLSRVYPAGSRVNSSNVGGATFLSCLQVLPRIA